MNNQRDWSSLPPDLVCFLAQKLHDISDFIRFRAVCKTWCFSTSASDFPHSQIPLILEGKRNNRNFRFYSVSLGKIYTIPCPSSHVDFWMLDGPSKGYMLVICNKKPYLYNPISCDRVSLPSIDIVDIPYVYFNDSIGAIRTGDYVLLYGWLETNMLAFCRPGDEKWTFVEEPDDYNYRCSVIYKGKLIYIEEETGITKAVDIDTGTFVYEIPKLENEDCFDNLVESSGEILTVVKTRYTSKTKNYVFNFRIYKLDEGNPMEEPRWIRIYSIGDQILFLDVNMQGLSLKANFGNAKGNCIYFLNEMLYKYNIDDETAERLYCPVFSLGIKSSSTWFLPKGRNN